jgi:biotin carboxylase
LFRGFLKDNGFVVPVSASFTNLKKAKEFASERLKRKPIMVKPADSYGSKGVSKLLILDDFDRSFNNAMNYSFAKIVVIEYFIEKTIYEMDGDGFVWNGKPAFICFGNQHNDLDCNPYVPMGISFPYIQEKSLQQKAHDILQSIVTKLNMRLGGLNVEYLTDKNENIYVLEIGPRSGGNLIPDVITLATGIDMIA